MRPALYRRRRRPGRGGGAATIAFDTYTRANSAVSLGTSDSGHAWTADSGTWGISTNQAYIAVASGALNVATIAGVANGSVACQFTNFENGMGVVFRYTDTNNMLIAVAQSPTTVELFKCVAGVFTQIGTAPYVWASGDIIKAVFSGTSISVLVNGVVKIAPVTEAAHQLATRAGKWGGGGAADTTRYDNFFVTVP